MNTQQIEELIPHRPPMRFVDRVLECTPGQSIVAERDIVGSDPVFAGHFPGTPVLPGVHQIEGLAQAAAIMIYADGKANASCRLVGVSKARFRAPVVPETVLKYEVQLLRSKGGFFWFSGKALVDGQVACDCEFSAKLG